MELKRYVLLKNGKIKKGSELFFGGYYEHEIILHYKNTRYFAGNFVKTSDNILDLVEVGDLVEIESSVYLHRVYEQIYKGLNNQVLPYIYMNVHIESQYPLKDVNREVIKAIYKRQPNGDYKRYEVK